MLHLQARSAPDPSQAKTYTHTAWVSMAKLSPPMLASMLIRPRLSLGMLGLSMVSSMGSSMGGMQTGMLTWTVPSMGAS
jgi:hypothetical protein